MMAIGRRRQLLLAGARIRGAGIAVAIAEEGAAFPSTEPTLLRTSLASRSGQSGRSTLILRGRSRFQ
jgi:hypothetical protein